MAKLSKRATERTYEIVKEVLKKYEKDLYIEVYADRDPETGMPMIEMFKMALEKAETPEEKEHFETIIATGIFQRKETIVNEDVAKKLDAEIDAKIEEEVAKGNLPKLSLQIIKKKTRKYVRKQKSERNSTATN